MIKADLFKLRKSRYMKVLFIISVMASIIMLSIAYVISTGTMPKEFGEFGFLFSDINIINLLSGILAGSMICSDFKNKSIHHAVASGKSRLSIVIGKGVVFLMAVVMLLIPYFITTLITLNVDINLMLNGAAEVGFMNLIKLYSGGLMLLSQLPKLLIIMISLIFIYTAQVSFCIPFAYLFKKPSIVIGVNYGFSMLFGALVKFRDRSSIFQKIFDCTPHGGNYIFMNTSTGLSTIIKSLIVSLLFISLMIFISYRIFKETDIK